MPSDAQNLKPFSRPVFAIFQGGGAAGIAHLGAAVAAEEEGLEFVGVAGASAGAFVAALLAAGYRGRELFNPETKGSDLLSRYNASPVGLLDAERWRQALLLRNCATRVVAGARWPRWLAGWVPLALRAWCMLRPHFAIIGRAYRNKGHFDTAGVRDFVNWAVREKLRDAYAAAGRPETDVPARVCFEHLDVKRFPGFRPLKIIATDVRSGEAALFSQDSAYAFAEIGACVAASIAIPGFFQPVCIAGLDGKQFVDGGLVSNLPTWTFLEEKLAYERRYPDEDRVPIVAFMLAEPAQAGPPDALQPGATADGQSVPAYLAAVIRAGIFGSQAVGQRLIADLVRVTLRPTLR